MKWGQVILWVSLGLGGLAFGFWIGTKEISGVQSRVQTERKHELNHELYRLTQDFGSKINLIRSFAGPLFEGAHPSLNSKLVLAWAQLHFKSPDPNSPYKLTRVGFSQHFLSQRPPLAKVGETWLRQALGKVTLEPTPIQMVFIKESLSVHPEFLGFLFKDQDPLAAKLIMVNPHELVSFDGDQDRTRRFFVLDDHGRVLVHSQPQYDGMDFFTLFKKLKPGQSPRKLTLSASYLSFDQKKVQAASLQLESFPLYLVAEIPTDYSQIGVLKKRRLAQSALAAMAVLFLGWFVRRFRSRRRGRKTIQTSAVPQALTPTQTATLSAAAAAIHSPDLVESAEREVLLSRFESDVERLLHLSKDPRSAVNRLTSHAAKLWNRPALFFSYHHETRLCVLRFYAGFAKAAAPERMSFQLDPPNTIDFSGEIQEGNHTWIEAVRKGFESGGLVSLSDHRQLVQLLVSKFGVTRFDSLPICLYEKPGELRVLGFMVILNPGPARTRDDLEIGEEPFLLSEENQNSPGRSHDLGF